MHRLFCSPLTAKSVSFHRPSFEDELQRPGDAGPASAFVAGPPRTREVQIPVELERGGTVIAPYDPCQRDRQSTLVVLHKPNVE
jgi:hypothetical protein